MENKRWEMENGKCVMEDGRWEKLDVRLEVLLLSGYSNK